jgi:hypothetical protein
VRSPRPLTAGVDVWQEGYGTVSTPIHEVPEPEGSDDKEVYAFYGLAGYAAQVLEKGLVNLVAGLHADGLSITRAEFDTLYARFDSSTFGQLVRGLRTKIQISPDTEMLLADALAKRNRLIHDFFADHAAAFMTEKGRLKMIAELRDLVALFQRADRDVERLWTPIAERRGLTEETVSQMEAEMLREFLAAERVK